MDIERIKKISEAKINAGKQVNNVRNTLKEFKRGLQDVQEELSEVYKPIVKAQDDVKQIIDEKQDKMLEQLQKNQKALTSGLEDLLMVQQLPDAKPQEAYKLPIDYEPEMLKPKIKSDIDTGFNVDEIKKLTEYKLFPPSQVLKASIDGTLDIDEYDEKIGKKLNKLGAKKGNLSKGKLKTKNKDQIDEITKDIKLIQKYRDRIQIIPEGKKTILGTGYTQPKRNAYKISSGGKYGNLIIDVPKLMGHLHLIATKNNEKVLDKKVDFDTIDLLTKRFNSKKKYSDLSKIVFNQLNKLSEIPIHRSSKKFSKIGSGIVYYNDTNDLIDRMELLGGSIMAGNDGAKSEFSEILHKLYEIGKIDNNQLNDLLKSYVIQL